LLAFGRFIEASLRGEKKLQEVIFEKSNQTGQSETIEELKRYRTQFGGSIHLTRSPPSLLCG
jgi:hypothetical protein